jgi:hypothetical protein
MSGQVYWGLPLGLSGVARTSSRGTYDLREKLGLRLRGDDIFTPS